VVGVGELSGVNVGVLVEIGVSGNVSCCKKVINLYCAELKEFLSGVSPYEYTVLVSLGCKISLFRIKRLSHST
jgi:hypothetical protein